MWSVKNGRFDPFGEDALTVHMNIKDIQRIHILDIEMGTWVTHLRNSPHVIVTPNSTLHMKRWETKLDPKLAIKVTQPNGSFGHASNAPSKRKGSEFDQDVIDLTVSGNPSPKKKKTEEEDAKRGSCDPCPASPLKLFSAMDDVAEVGARPARLARFPARTVGQMVPRIGWIVAQSHSGESDETVKSLFMKVFSCEYKKTTYYKHQGVWRWLRDNSVLDESKESDLWGPLVRAATAALKAEKTNGISTQTKREASVEL